MKKLIIIFISLLFTINLLSQKIYNFNTLEFKDRMGREIHNYESSIIYTDSIQIDICIKDLQTTYIINNFNIKEGYIEAFDDEAYYEFIIYKGKIIIAKIDFVIGASIRLFNSIKKDDKVRKT